jgi:hypothetical protein
LLTFSLFASYSSYPFYFTTTTYQRFKMSQNDDKKRGGSEPKAESTRDKLEKASDEELAEILRVADVAQSILTSRGPAASNRMDSEANEAFSKESASVSSLTTESEKDKAPTRVNSMGSRQLAFKDDEHDKSAAKQPVRVPSVTSGQSAQSTTLSSVPHQPTTFPTLEEDEHANATENAPCWKCLIL